MSKFEVIIAGDKVSGTDELTLVLVEPEAYDSSAWHGWNLWLYLYMED